MKKFIKYSLFGIIYLVIIFVLAIMFIVTAKADLTKQKELFNVKIPVYWGGPVNQNKILILHSQEYKNETTKNFKNLSISSDYKILFEIADKKGPKKSLIILGISSWGPGQLEGEMEMEKWILSEINTDLIFEMDNAKKWLNAINNSFIRL